MHCRPFHTALFKSKRVILGVRCVEAFIKHIIPALNNFALSLLHKSNTLQALS